MNPTNSLDDNKFTYLQERVLAIMEFVHNYDEDVTMNSLLNGFSFYKTLIMSERLLIENHPDDSLNELFKQFTFRCEIKPNSSTWSYRVMNYVSLFKKIEQYVSKAYKLKKKINFADINLIGLCKYEDEAQVIKIFELLIAILIESPGKDSFIQKIMNLQESSQEHFVDLIQNSLETRLVQTVEPFNQTHIISDYMSNLCTHISEQFLTETKAIQNQNMTLSITNSQLQSQLAQTLEEIDLSYKKSTFMEDSSIDDLNKINKLESKIKSLKQKLIDNERQYQSQKQHLMHEMSLLQSNQAKYSELEQLCGFYKEKYEMMMDQVKMVSVWKKQKIKLEKMIDEKQFVINKMKQRIEEMEDKNSALEEKDLQAKLKMQKKNIMLEKLEEEIKGIRQKFGNQPQFNLKREGRRNGSRGLGLFGINTASKNFIDCLQEEEKQNQTLKSIQESAQVRDLEESRRQNQEYKQKIRKLQKQLKKSEYKTDRTKILEDEKKKLEYLVYQLTVNQNEEIKLLTSVMCENYIQGKDNWDRDQIIEGNSRQRRRHHRKTSIFDQTYNI